MLGVERSCKVALVDVRQSVAIAKMSAEESELDDELEKPGRDDDSAYDDTGDLQWDNLVTA